MAILCVFSEVSCVEATVFLQMLSSYKRASNDAFLRFSLMSVQRQPPKFLHAGRIPSNLSRNCVSSIGSESFPVQLRR